MPARSNFRRHAANLAPEDYAGASGQGLDGSHYVAQKRRLENQRINAAPVAAKIKEKL